MLRIRFRQPTKDHRPVTFPPPHPWWCTGYDPDDVAILVAYADSEEQLLEYWPEAIDLDSCEVDGYTFSARFPKPDWFDSAREAESDG